MNISEINPGTLGNLSIYVAIALPLTLVTAWIIIAFQSRYIFPDGTPFIRRLSWPVKLLSNMMKKEKDDDDPPSIHSELGRDGDSYSYHDKETPPSHSSD